MMLSYNIAACYDFSFLYWTFNYPAVHIYRPKAFSKSPLAAINRAEQEIPEKRRKQAEFSHAFQRCRGKTIKEEQRKINMLDDADCLIYFLSSFLFLMFSGSKWLRYTSEPTLEEIYDRPRIHLCNLPESRRKKLGSLMLWREWFMAMINAKINWKEFSLRFLKFDSETKSDLKFW